jgi:hypothetical protein
MRNALEYEQPAGTARVPHSSPSYRDEQAPHATSSATNQPEVTPQIANK